MIAYTRTGTGPPVLCLHGWPGGVSDHRELVARLVGDGPGAAEVVVPHLLGFGDSFVPGDVDRPASDFGRDAQVAALVELLDALDLPPVVVVGYDVGSTTGIALARAVPGRVRALVLGNAIHPGAAARSLDPDHRHEFWYQDFHQLALASSLVDGSPDAVRAYLGHFWSHWGHRPVAAVTEELVDAYARPGAFTVSLNWYRSGSATLATALAARGAPPPPPVDVPATVLWGARDPLFPASMAEGLDALLPRAEVRVLDDVGHFVPLEAADETAAAVREHLARRDG